MYISQKGSYEDALILDFFFQKNERARRCDFLLFLVSRVLTCSFDDEERC